MTDFPMRLTKIYFLRKETIRIKYSATLHMHNSAWLTLVLTKNAEKRRKVKELSCEPSAHIGTLPYAMACFCNCLWSAFSMLTSGLCSFTELHCTRFFYGPPIDSIFPFVFNTQKCCWTSLFIKTLLSALWKFCIL